MQKRLPEEEETLILRYLDEFYGVLPDIVHNWVLLLLTGMVLEAYAA